ncbi:MAG: mechanosensitive ion channel [Muribaculaceae bacterium]|nr:mechanosensitive ion channel [Muribaculaceae bacterium]
MIQSDLLPLTDAPQNIETTKGFLESLKGLGFEDALHSIANGIVHFSFRLMIAILVFYLGKFIIKKLYSLVYGILVSRAVDASLTTFVLSLVRMVLYFILIITVIGIIGIETSSFLALFASAGVAIGMALSGTLQNFAGGVLILLLKPYKVGDFIEAQGFSGTVKEIQIFHTIINTTDNKGIIIPNGGLSTGSINNYSREDYRRVDWKIGLSYGCDYAAARELIISMLMSDDRIVKTTIEADRKYRSEKENESKLEHQRIIEQNKLQGSQESESQESVKKEGWWKRFRRRRKEKQLIIQEKLRDKVSLNENISLNEQKEVPPFVGLSELADSSVNLVIRAWTRSDFYWGVFFGMNERFYKELPEHGFSFPFPQMDIHIADVPSELTENLVK